MRIDSLSQREQKLLSRMPEKGDFDDKHKYLLEHGIYHEWRSIFCEYVDLAIGGNLEALKRAIFFVWYETSEPSVFSGLLDLGSDKVLAVVENLNTRLSDGLLDEELAWMLPYYYKISDWYLPQDVPIKSLLDVSSIKDDSWIEGANASNFSNRGLLGDYWLSIKMRTE